MEINQQLKPIVAGLLMRGRKPKREKKREQKRTPNLTKENSNKSH